MSEFNTLEEVADELKNTLGSESAKKKIGLLFAFNSTGKTRLSSLFNKESEKTVLSYNAFFEDLFIWDNEDYVIEFNPNHYILSFIRDQGLEKQITDNFQKLIKAKVEPNFDFEAGKITFNFSPGDERSEDNIKISRGEESLFVWSIFYTVLEAAAYALSVEEGTDGDTSEFNEIEYVVIDDPVSSIDDTRIINLALELTSVIHLFGGSKIKFLITTHHPLFYNVLHKEFFNNKKCKTLSYILQKNDYKLKLSEQKDSPFGYHLAVRDVIRAAIEADRLERYHFNLFRSLLEKTSNFLGYNKWSECLNEEDKSEIYKLINHYSHGRLSDLESRILSEDDKNLFIKAFNNFIADYRWKI